ncbi:MAG: hypothetical protein ACWGPN_17925 [Gammaproteobacteria bacterium]
MILIPAVLLVVGIVVDLSQLFRPSGLAALACTVDLVAETPEPLAVVARYHDTIVAQAARHDLPAELVAAVIVNHQRYLSPFRRFTDCSGSAMGANLSLGLAQLRVSTAAQLDGMLFDQMSASEYRSLRSRLLEPELNIEYEARELRSLLERKHRYPGIDAETLIHDPFAIALLVTEYRAGRMRTPAEQSRLSAEAFGALRVIQEETLELFGRDREDARVIRGRIGEYLDFIYCESGIFNSSVCEAARNR